MQPPLLPTSSVDPSDGRYAGFYTHCMHGTVLQLNIAYRLSDCVRGIVELLAQGETWLRTYDILYFRGSLWGVLMEYLCITRKLQWGCKGKE